MSLESACASRAITEEKEVGSEQVGESLLRIVAAVRLRRVSPGRLGLLRLPQQHCLCLEEPLELLQSSLQTMVYTRIWMARFDTQAI